MSSIRIATVSDVPALLALLERNREFLAPFDPSRDEDFYTQQRQTELLESQLREAAEDRCLPCVILADGAVVGRITISNIVRGVFQSANLGYWLDEAHGGRGLASTAVAEAIDLAFNDLNLHRLEAGTLTENLRSQRVLEKNGFTRYGLAPQYLKINGEWRDHVLFQRLATEA